MKVLFYVDKKTKSVQEIERTPEREKMSEFYPTRKDAVRTLFLQLCEESEAINAQKAKVYEELIELVTKER